MLFEKEIGNIVAEEVAKVEFKNDELLPEGVSREDIFTRAKFIREKRKQAERKIRAEKEEEEPEEEESSVAAGGMFGGSDSDESSDEESDEESDDDTGDKGVEKKAVAFRRVQVQRTIEEVDGLLRRVDASAEINKCVRPAWRLTHPNV